MKAQQTVEAEGVLFGARDLAEIEPGLSYGGIRSDITLREFNGLAKSGAIIHRGRRILIHRPRYLAWLMGERSAA